jgi:hypothetical protein
LLNRSHAHSPIDERPVKAIESRLLLEWCPKRRVQEPEREPVPEQVPEPEPVQVPEPVRVQVPERALLRVEPPVRPPHHHSKQWLQRLLRQSCHPLLRESQQQRR